MYNLKNELIEMVEIFDYFQISESRQINIIKYGVNFEFYPGDIIRLNCFSFVNFLKLCKSIDNEFSATQLLDDMNNRRYKRYKKYEVLVKKIFFMEEIEKDSVKQLIKSPSKPRIYV